MKAGLTLVADESRSDKTICLAVSPSLKAIGVGSHLRLFEAKQAIALYEARQHCKVGASGRIGEKMDIEFWILLEESRIIQA